jgi:DNA-binding winged helix-turn-helix (wHTH) protein/tetratricopeptide (TPR) repeat protein
VSGDFKVGSCVVQPSLNGIVRNGTARHLEPKMMEVLVRLAEQPGEVISREQLIRAVWPDAFVTDDVLTRCISELRRALEDDSKGLQVIQTIPKRGYRLVAEVQPVTPGPAAVLVSPRTAETGSPVFTTHRWSFLAGAAVLVAGGIVASIYPWTHRVPKLTPKDPIIVADFTNTTGDPVFDGSLRQGLMAQLEQSPYLDIRSDEQVADTMRLMAQPAGMRLTRVLARQVCERIGGAAVLDGSIAQIGNQYSLILNALNCSSGALLASAQAVASDKNHVLGALSNVASSMRAKLGESLASIGKFNKPLEEVTTPSLEALQAYSLGWHAIWDVDGAAAISSQQLQRAASLDPSFAMAYAVLGTSYYNLNETRLAAENLRKAYELRERVSEREKFYISSHYEILVTGDLEKGMQVLELWAQTYPRDVVPMTDLTVGYLLLGLYQKGLVPARRALDLDPMPVNYGNLTDNLLCLDRLDEAAAILQRANAHGMHSQTTDAAEYELAFLEGDSPRMARETAWAAGKPGVEDLFLDYESGTAAYVGRLGEANALTARAVTSARQSGQRDTAALYLAEAALRQALVGNVPEARHDAAAALQLSNGRHTEGVAALTLALAGHTDHARKLVADLTKRFPQDTVVQFNYLPTVRAAIALGQKSPAKAIADLQAASSYELGTPALLVFVNLYPVYVRGQAYLAARQGVSAAAEFQKILDRRGIAFNEVIVPLAHLGLGRARALTGDLPGARNAYQDFFSLWQHADLTVPILKQARAEYAKLPK